MNGTEAARTLELVTAAERAVVRLLLAMGEPIPHVGAASYYAVATAAKLEAVWQRVERRIGPQPESPAVCDVAAALKDRGQVTDPDTTMRLRNAIDRAATRILEAKRKDGAE